MIKESPDRGGNRVGLGALIFLALIFVGPFLWAAVAGVWSPAATPIPRATIRVITVDTSDDLPGLAPKPPTPDLRPPADLGNESGENTPGCAGGCTTRPTWCAEPIKGNISLNTGEKIYHVPGQEYYDATEIATRYGERWFCTEEEALAAGWRRSRQ